MKRARCLLLIFASLLLAACASGGGDVRSEPPTLQIEGLALQSGRVRLDLLVHNPNDHPLKLEGVSLAMEIDDGSALFADDWPLTLQMGPRVNERLQLETRVQQPAGRRLLEQGRARRASIGYALEMEIRVTGQGNKRGERTNFLHPVPGQPGQFR
jgi:LEA14-like dessication related protein